MNKFVKVGKLSQFPESLGTGVTVEGRAVCVARMKEKLFAFDDRCTHAESLLSGGDVEGCEILCPLHGARFSIETGEALTLPAVKPVQTHEVKVEGDNVYVKLK
jgi:3-phenylpropionate/trans-cinnamate dioxygenase ferredoxin subunit